MHANSGSYPWAIYASALRFQRAHRKATEYRVAEAFAPSREGWRGLCKAVDSRENIELEEYVGHTGIQGLDLLINLHDAWAVALEGIRLP
jgi:hypothetical protein